MKKFQNKRIIILCIFFAGVLTSLFSFSSAAQDSSKTKKGVVVLKIEKDDNGKTTVIDTTFNITSHAGQKEFEKFMAKHEEELAHLGVELEKEFDVPCPPDFDFSPFHGYEDFEGDFRPGHDMKVLRYNHDSPTLSDILGDIPMERVKSYSVKERKNGKRIMIDIEDAPLLDNQDKMIIVRERGKHSHKMANADRQMKVIIKSDGSIQKDDSSEIPPPPPPPPPKK